MFTIFHFIVRISKNFSRDQASRCVTAIAKTMYSISLHFWMRSESTYRILHLFYNPVLDLDEFSKFDLAKPSWNGSPDTFGDVCFFSQVSEKKQASSKCHVNLPGIVNRSSPILAWCLPACLTLVFIYNQLKQTQSQVLTLVERSNPIRTLNRDWFLVLQCYLAVHLME